MLIYFARQTKPVIPSATLSSGVRRCLIAVLACLAACGTFEQQRIAQLLHEKGFGTRAEGDATQEDYIGGQDHIQFLLDPAIALNPAATRLVEMTAIQAPGLDGTIYVPYVGPVYVLGRTETELAALVKSQFAAIFTFPIDLQVRIIDSNKFYYAIGEVNVKGRHRLAPDITFMDAMFDVGWTNFANLGRVYLVRPDAETPLVVDINFREMCLTGFTAANLNMKEHDIIYIPPTFLGLLGRLLQRITEPVGLAVRTLLGLAQIRTSYEVVTGQRDSLYTFRY